MATLERMNLVERTNSKAAKYKVRFNPRDASKLSSGARYDDSVHFEPFNRLASYAFTGVN